MKRTHAALGLVLSALVGAMVIPGNVLIVQAAEGDDGTKDSFVPAAGIEAVLSQSYETDEKDNIGLYVVPSDGGEYLNRAFSKVTDFAYVRSAPKKTKDWVGKIYHDSAVNVLACSDGWAKIQSGNVKGYVPVDVLYTGEEAREHEPEYRKEEAVVTADVLNVREKGNTDAAILTQIEENQRYAVAGEAVDNWYPLKVGENEGWVYGKYVRIETVYSYAESKKEEEKRLAEEAAAEKKEQEVREAAAEIRVSGGQAVVDFACQFIGNPYVWGGTSLTEGADCSGFVQSVYRHFGINLPRTTWDMETVGQEVSYEQALPGDLVLYDGHVGLYMGDGNIVNAMNEEDGIGICSAAYQPIITIRRVL